MEQEIKCLLTGDKMKPASWRVWGRNPGGRREERWGLGMKQNWAGSTAAAKGTCNQGFLLHGIIVNVRWVNRCVVCEGELLLLGQTKQWNTIEQNERVSCVLFQGERMGKSCWRWQEGRTAFFGCLGGDSSGGRRNSSSEAPSEIMVVRGKFKATEARA